MLAPLLAGVLTSAQAETQTLNLYNWFGLLAPETPADFKKATGVSLHIDSFDSGEVMQGKLLAGRTGYDVVVATSNLLPALIKAGVLEPLDRSKLKNYSHIDPELLSKLAANDPGNKFAIPYLWGTTGLGYDVDKVKAALGESAPVDSWDLVFKEENIKKLKSCGVAMLDSPSEIVSIALHYLGLPYNSQNPEDYKKAEALLRKIQPYVAYFDSSKVDADLANGNICVVVAWANTALAAKDVNEKTHSGRRIAYSLPREGALVWSENFVLLKDAPHPHQGLSFIDYMMEPEVIAKTSNYSLYPNGNKDSLPFIDTKLKNDSFVYPTTQEMARLFPLEPLPLKYERIRTRVWVSVKSGV